MFNYDLLRHPYNWIVVILMITIAVMGAKLIWPEMAALPRTFSPS